ncbi:tRNA (adenosine(37)-N6)-threonylcarbamoyltransferase complex dimerization subunit type 1 TsaB [Mollicutes bacterium LVI A0078]|nr:tRNA (adenosine(37)-N6)-threonylcarbamoyltransferase complex dimerization subunit type 1 TsaB [Mollicutes bacterium LVI A0075]WOO90830.1 tRNA (adenosine(37)-N6)-threonylcarbamoyltransferase complex dimerization subunit type 1 TsaB [Mollicutes bacterium LVI A0078]
MKLLIDTTTKYVTIVTFDDTRILKSIQYEGNNNHTTTIYEHLSKLDFEAIREIYVTAGPGSYTGVRIGVLVAKTLAQEINAKLFKINTLNLFYAGFKNDVLLDARGKKYFKYDGNEYTFVGYDDVTSETIIDGYINPDWLLDSTVITQFEECHPLNLEIEYLKEAI